MLQPMMPPPMMTMRVVPGTPMPVMPPIALPEFCSAGVARADRPRAGIHPDAIAGRVARELGAQRSFDFAAPRFGEWPRFAEDLASRTEGELELQRLLDVAADHYRPVDSLERKVGEARRRELRTDDL